MLVTNVPVRDCRRTEKLHQQLRFRGSLSQSRSRSSADNEPVVLSQQALPILINLGGEVIVQILGQSLREIQCWFKATTAQIV